jgi:tRNA-splicing ligase RtcB (3'-phosphate/5'-hydroxy nucleic acid ligase)
VDSPEAKASRNSTVHARPRESQATLHPPANGPLVGERGVKVIAQHASTVKVPHTLRPFAVAMAGAGELDPFEDALVTKCVTLTSRDRRRRYINICGYDY